MSKDTMDHRVDAADKLDASVKYIRDEKIPDMWYGTTIRSSLPHAKITDIKYNTEFDWESVVIVTHSDVPVNYVAMLEKDMPFLAEKIVRYAGEPVVLIAAENKTLLNEAKKHIKVDYHELPALFDMTKSENSPVKIYSDNNVFKDIDIQRGDVDQARKNADQIIEIETSTGYQEHLYLEPQGIIALPKENAIEIRGSLQCPYYVKNALVTLFDNKKHITIIQAPTGGAFGGKEDYPSLLAGHAALLAVKCGHPVAMFYDREEDVLYTPKRHPSHSQNVAYVKKDGTITGIEVNVLLDGGAYCTLSQVVLARTALAAIGSYFIPNTLIKAKAVATNTVPNGAFRGFGGPQAIFSIEMTIEKVAAVLNLNPDEVRSKNLIRKGQETATGQVLKYSVSAHETLNETLLKSGYKQKLNEFRAHNKPILNLLSQRSYPRTAANEMLHGIGLCSFLHGAGFTGTGENKIQGKVTVKLEPEGKLLILSASTEMGQGEQTVMRTILARAMDVDRSLIILADVNTDLVPDSGPTVASRTTMIVGSLLIEAAKDIKNHLLAELGKNHDDDFIYRDGIFSGNRNKISFSDAVGENSGFSVTKSYKHPPIIKFDDVNWQGDAYPVFSWGASVAEIEVDPITFEIRVVRYTTTQDIGKAINYDQAVAQVQGGSLQGIGYALYEKMGLNRGYFNVTGFTDYIIPTTAETPEFDVHIMENPYPYGPFGAKGLGELPLVGAAPAVVSALRMIFNRNFTSIPVLPEHLTELFYTENI